MNREEYFASWSALHGGARVTGIVKWWLSISFAISKVLIAFRLTPNLLSLLGVAASVLSYTFAKHYYALPILALSLLCDGVDGTVAILTSKDNKRGAMLDSVCDRISESFWALGFFALGAPAWVIATAYVFAFTQEYARARIAGLGDYRIDIVTIAERPVRASFLAVAMVAWDLKISAVTTLAIVWMVQQGIALVTVMRSGYTRLHATDGVGD